MTSAVQGTYSVRVNAAINEYNKHIGVLTNTYQSIEGAKGRWHVRWDEYKAGRFPATQDELASTLNSELDAYQDLAKATEQSKTLLTLFRTTVEYCTRARISPSDYETLQRGGYQTTPSMEGEEVLPQICTHLETLFSRIEVIKLHMNDRLPKAAANLNGVFHEVFKRRQESTWGDTARNLVVNNYLEKALDQRLAAEGTPKTDASVPAETSLSTGKTTPEDELAALGKILEELKILSSKDPLTKPSTEETVSSIAVSNPKESASTKDLETSPGDLKKSASREREVTLLDPLTTSSAAAVRPNAWDNGGAVGKKKGVEGSGKRV